MKNFRLITLFILNVMALYSCSDKKDRIGEWNDNIHLSTKTAEFKSSGDSIIITTQGSSWWITGISVDNNSFVGLNNFHENLSQYTIAQDCFVVERRDKNTLFIKVTANPLSTKRIISVDLEDGDYFDRVTITQKSN